MWHGEQVFDGEDVGPIQGVGGPRAQPQLGDRRIVGRGGQQLAKLRLVGLVGNRPGSSMSLKQSRQAVSISSALSNRSVTSPAECLLEEGREPLAEARIEHLRR